MPFILRIQSYRNQPLPTPLSRCFDAAGGSIGRTPDNDLVLQDPSKSISRKHARIDCRDGGYYLTDLGSNPSLVNELPLGNGKEARLNDGDRIAIGDYLIEAVFEADIGLPPAPPRVVPARAVPQPLFQPALEPHVDPLAAAAILGGAAGSDTPARERADPLGLNLFGGTQADPLSNAFTAAQSDHISPEIQAFPVTPAPVAPAGKASASMAIPDDYDPLADLRPVSAPVPAAQAAPAQPMRAAAPAADSEVLQALLRGLGLPVLATGRSAPETAELVGAMLREAVAGTMGVLLARAMTKREIRIDTTVMASQANNPLKFFPDADSALKQMLTNELPGYLPPVKAIGVAFDDLKAHELAIIAGMRAALSGVLQRFDPAEIERQLKNASMMDSMLAANRKAKMWDRLVELYADIEREADDDFQRLFGEKFSTAYEELVERLRSGQNRHK